MTAPRPWSHLDQAERDLAGQRGSQPGVEGAARPGCTARPGLWAFVPTGCSGAMVAPRFPAQPNPAPWAGSDASSHRHPLHSGRRLSEPSCRQKLHLEALGPPPTPHPAPASGGNRFFIQCESQLASATGDWRPDQDDSPALSGERWLSAWRKGGGGNSGGPGMLEQIWDSLEGGVQAVFPGARVALLRPGGQECDPGEDREAHSHKHAGHFTCQLTTHVTHTIHT